MTDREKDAEIKRLTPYAMKYAGDFLRTTRGRLTARHRGGTDDLLADAILLVCEFVARDLPAPYFKKFLIFRLRDLADRSQARPRYAQESPAPGLSLAESVVDYRGRRDPLAAAARVELFRATRRLPLLTRCALRRSLLGDRQAYRDAPCSLPSFFYWRGKILKEIKKRLEFSAATAIM
ncbi:hypothetical protein IJ103_00045 [Candidatus Saccharibacteria bacterium]|nr:hypothetical protein [Candidatus Saccharibacteria bacterium]